MIKGYLGLGSNLGDRRENIKKARRLLEERSVVVTKASRMYETEPWGVNEPQDNYYNAVLAFEFDGSPLELLDICQEAENALGRKRERRYGARTVDIDILWVEGVRMDHERLILPHPGLTDRPFVVLPLAEIAPGLELEGGMTVEARRRQIGLRGIVRILDD